MIAQQTFEGKYEVRCFDVEPHTSIKHPSDDEQWQVTLRSFPLQQAFVCMKNEEVELVNDSTENIKVITIRGNCNLSDKDLTKFFYGLGFSVWRSSMTWKD